MAGPLPRRVFLRRKWSGKPEIPHGEPQRQVPWGVRREIIVTEMLSLDGVIEAPGGETGYRNAGWTFNDVEFDPAAYELKGTEQKEAGALLLGRKSYEAFAPIWPSREEFAGYNAMPRFVVSTT